MTNEEKAMQIAEENLMTYVALENDGGTYEVDSEAECYRSAIDMAIWMNEKQHKELVHPVVEWLEHIQQLASDRENFNNVATSEIVDTLNLIKSKAELAIFYIKNVTQYEKFRAAMNDK